MANHRPLKAFEDPKHIGNTAKFHTGKPCIEPGCDKPAGTAWSPYWCFEHNVQRIKRISRQFDELLKEQEKRDAQARSNRTR